MALSNSQNFSTTRNDLILGALRLIGAIGQGETASSVQITEASEALNMMVKAWQADGMSLWVTKEYSLTLLASTASYTPTVKMMKVLQAYNRNTASSVDIPMRIITIDEYNRLGNKTSSGNPIQLVHIPNRTDSTIKVFPVPTSVEAAANTIKITYQKPYDDFDAATDEPEFPSEWFDALKYGLAFRLAGEYGVSLQDRRQLMQEAALMKSEVLLYGTEEGSIKFSPDNRW